MPQQKIPAQPYSSIVLRWLKSPNPQEALPAGLQNLPLALWNNRKTC
ncbi:MAG: hypothetical protein AB7T38_04785 [Nitrospirales bacterium]